MQIGVQWQYFLLVNMEVQLIILQKTTTGNSSGIYNVGSNWTQTTGILSTANKNSTPYVSGLFNDDGSVKNI